MRNTSITTTLRRCTRNHKKAANITIPTTVHKDPEDQDYTTKKPGMKNTRKRTNFKLSLTNRKKRAKPQPKQLPRQGIKKNLQCVINT